MRFPLRLVGVLALGLGALIAAMGPAQAQGNGWTPPRLVFEGQGLVDWPAIFADEYGAVHGLWILRTEGSGNTRRLVYYARLDRANWQPIDIFSYRGASTSLGANHWAEGLLVSWNGSQYGLSGLAPDVSAKAWRGPFELASSYFQPGLGTDPDGGLWMAFGSPADKAIYVQRLDPGTEAWSTPKLVAYAVTPNTAPDWVRLAFSQDGSLHVVWAEYQLPEGFPPVGVYYARSADAGDTWTTPRETGPAGANQPFITTGPDKQVYVSWVGMAGMGGKYLEESLDGGLTWLERTTLIPPGGGSQGSMLLAVDTGGTLHAVVANDGCVWHFFREGDAWAPGECISEPLPQTALKEFPAMALGLGNQLHVLFWTDRQQLWYVTRQLDVPGIEPQVLPTAAPATATVERLTQAPDPTATYLPDLGPPPDPGASAQSATLSVLAGIVPVALFFLVVGVVRIRRRK